MHGRYEEAHRSFVEKLHYRLGNEAPDWLVVLAEFTDANSLRISGKRLNYSATVISQVLNGKYPGDIDRVEKSVRGALLGSVVICPVLGEIGLDRCLFEQKQPFRSTGANRAQLFHTCRGGCPNARNLGGKT